MPTKDLIATASILISAPTAKVWSALTDPALIKRYMFGANVVSDWRVSSPIVWRGEWQGKPYEDRGTILALEPGRAIQYSHYSPLSGVADLPENYHTVTVELSGEGAQTRVKLSQDHNATEQERDNSQGMWLVMLEGMKKVVEQETGSP